MALLQRKKMNGKVVTKSGANLLDTPFFAPLDLWNLNSNLLDWRMTSETPPANFIETNTNYQIDICVPGMKRENFEINIQNKMLTVSCDLREDKKKDKTLFSGKEFDYHHFSRSFRLPENVLEEKIHARYDNGILNISIPKKEITKEKLKKSITVK